MEERDSDMVAGVQEEWKISEAVCISVCDVDDPVPDIAEAESVDEPVVQCNGRLGHLGNSERRETIDNRVHRECDPDDAVHRDGDVDIRCK